MIDDVCLATAEATRRSYCQLQRRRDQIYLINLQQVSVCTHTRHQRQISSTRHSSRARALTGGTHRDVEVFGDASPGGAHRAERHGLVHEDSQLVLVLQLHLRIRAETLRLVQPVKQTEATTDPCRDYNANHTTFSYIPALATGTGHHGSCTGLQAPRSGGSLWLVSDSSNKMTHTLSNFIGTSAV